MIIWSVCIVLTAGLLVTAGLQLDYINDQRADMKLIIDRPENVPPTLAFATIATGAFRGLLVDILWIRADSLKEQGQFFDARQLAEWITVLQPRFAAVWEFHAWNMAYNISVAIPATQPDQRWRWVKNGYELLRDKGLEVNPKAIALYRELARIFQHKIGGVSDDAHKYYKLQLAAAMEPLLGPADNEYFEALAQAPADWQPIAADPNIAPLITALKSADPAFVKADDIEFVRNYLSLRQRPDRYDPKAFETVDAFRGTKALERFDIFAKAYQLRKTWKLDPVLMQQLNNTYGPIDWSDPNKHLPLDWRHPDVHAIYWAVRGLQVAGREEFSADEANTDRIVAHSLQNLFRYGKIFIYEMPAAQGSQTVRQTAGDQPGPVGREIFLRPDLRMFGPYNNTVLAILEKYKELKEGTYESLQNGHRNMLKNAVLSFYQAGHIRYAQKIYQQLRELYPLDEFKAPLVQYVKNRFRYELESIGINNAREIIQMMLMESYFRYAVRDDDEASGREELAKEIYDHYQSLFSDEGSKGRINLLPFPVLRYLALRDFLNDPQYPLEFRRSLLARIKLERPELAEQLEQEEAKQLEQIEQERRKRL